ncbi:hypothetical protein ACWEN3_39340, partial [Streptomyces sp. NPDC004561]
MALREPREAAPEQNGNPSGEKFGVRGYTRCQRCGRPHSVYRKFGLCRV